MSSRVEWEPSFSTGNEKLDEQHRNLLAQCRVLAACLADVGEEGERSFRGAFDALMSLAREHYSTEAALLARGGGAPAELDAHRHEGEEFDYLAAEIVTTDNFDRGELERFLSLWWAGHVMSAARLRDTLTSGRSGA